LRKKATNDFEKNYYKLGNNSVFGKTLENVRGRSRCEMIFSEKRFQKVIKELQYKSHDIINQDTVLVERYKNKVVLNKPVYAGAVILQRSKLQMYYWYYGFFKKLYGDKVTLCFTDTDSLIIYVECEDIYKDINDNRNLFDMSDYPKNYKNMEGKLMFDETNKKELQKIKDETQGQVISSHYGVRAKNYSTMVDTTYCKQFNYKNEKGKPINWNKFNNNVKKKLKGVSHEATDKITHQDFKNVIENGEKTTCQMSSFRSFHQQIYTVEMEKVALNSWDDKRQYLSPNLSVPWGYQGKRYANLL
jgi:hypothetical protein